MALGWSVLGVDMEPVIQGILATMIVSLSVMIYSCFCSNCRCCPCSKNEGAETEPLLEDIENKGNGKGRKGNL